MGTEASISETMIWGCKMAKVLEPHTKQQTIMKVSVAKEEISLYDSIKTGILGGSKKDVKHKSEAWVSGRWAAQ